MSPARAALAAALIGLIVFFVSCYALTVLSTIIAAAVSQEAATQAFTMHTLIAASLFGTVLLGLWIASLVRRRLSPQ